MIAHCRRSLAHDKPALPGLMMAVLLLSLPNLLNTFFPKVDPNLAECFWLGVGVTLLPAVFSATVRTTMLLWVPLAAFIPVTMLYTLLSHTVLREWAVLSLIQVPAHELQRYTGSAIAVIVLGLLTAYVYFRFVSRHVIANHRLGWMSRTAVLVLALVIPLAQVMKSGWAFGAMRTQRQMSATFPLGPLVAVGSALNIQHHLQQRGSIVQQIEARPTTQPGSPREIYVLVIGESARFSSFQINGYPRETTPLLAKTEGLLSFQNVTAPATVTLMSVPVLLTPAGAIGLNNAAEMPSVVGVFKKAGFHTAWFSTQKRHGMYDTACSIYANDADETLFPSGDLAEGEGTYKAALDGVLLDPLKKLITGTKQNLFIVLHTMGSHQHYSDRVPPEFNHFESYYARCEGNAFTGKYTDEQIRNLTNAYDNTVLYTDWFLASVTKLLKETSCVSAMYYVSDHGQNRGDAAVLPFAHGSVTPDVVQVPMMIWLSPAYRDSRKEKAQALQSHLHTPFSADTTFHTLIGMAALESPLLKPDHSAASASFHPGARLLRDLEGVVVDYDDLMNRRAEARRVSKN